MRRKRQNKHRLPEGDINIVSLMDILTSLLFFILLLASTAKFSVINAFSSISGKDEEKKERFSLQVDIDSRGSAQVILGPIAKLKMVNGKRLKRYLRRNFIGNSKKGYTRKYWGKTNKQLLKRIQFALVKIKQGFPHESNMVLAINDRIKYQNVINSMGAMREIASDAKAFKEKNLLGIVRMSRVLFPGIILMEKEK